MVITIVILIILATVAINFAFGENGLIKQAELARDLSANSTKYEEDSMTNLAIYMNELLGEEGGSKPEKPTVPETVEDSKKDETKFDNTTTIKDGLDNNVVIPGGFHVDKESGSNVEEGIVIEDDIGNQFVWIPIGTYHTTKGDKTNNLSRRSWGEKDVVKDPTEVSGDEVIKYSPSSSFGFYGEGGDATSIAKDTIEIFKRSATEKGGFYIGRFEQGKGNVCKKNVMPWVNLTRDKAYKQAKEMYGVNGYVTSELISSYAWDTALNFICQNNENGYKLATTTDSSYGNIGTENRTNTGMYTSDKYSNVYDMLGNCLEWTTEAIGGTAGYTTCVGRGGYYDSPYSLNYAAYRGTYSESSSDPDISFRIQLYIK